MKTRILLTILLAALGLCGSGCARTYVITLRNGSRIAAVNKPKLQQGVYIFKDVQGRPSYLPAGRVREISPASMSQDQKSRFNPSVKP